MAASDGQLGPGRMLAGKYRLDRLLGQGGMGAVWLGENTDIGRQVAIKFLHADFAADAEMLSRFRLEARAAAAIGHPGIVDVLDMGRDDAGAFIVMERLDGETLGDRIDRYGALPIDEVVSVVAQVADALAAAHEKGVIHRDLKPDNLFLVERPVPAVKVLDFGLSKFQRAEDLGLTRTGMVMGTPLYMSPEQARGSRDVNHSTDLYSLGAILYHALVGQPPVDGESYNEVIAKLLTEAHVPLQRCLPHAPPALAALVDGLLEKDWMRRPPSARSVKEALDAIRNGTAVAPLPLTHAVEALPLDRTAPSQPKPHVAIAEHGLEDTAPPRAAAQPVYPSTVVRPPSPPPAPRRRPLVAVLAAAALLLVGGAAALLLRKEPPQIPVPVAEKPVAPEPAPDPEPDPVPTVTAELPVEPASEPEPVAPEPPQRPEPTKAIAKPAKKRVPEPATQPTPEPAEPKPAKAGGVLDTMIDVDFGR